MTIVKSVEFGNQFEGGDEIVISIFWSEMFEVKECGMKIVYEEYNGIEEDDDSYLIEQ